MVSSTWLSSHSKPGYTTTISLNLCVAAAAQRKAEWSGRITPICIVSQPLRWVVPAESLAAFVRCRSHIRTMRWLLHTNRPEVALFSPEPHLQEYQSDRYSPATAYDFAACSRGHVRMRDVCEESLAPPACSKLAIPIVLPSRSPFGLLYPPAAEYRMPHCR